MTTLALQSNYRIVPKVLTTSAGVSMLVIFLVREENGELSFTVLGAKPLHSNESHLCITGDSCSCAWNNDVISTSFGDIAIPREAHFLTLQRTRAPNFAF
jgi:hypothetical protein